MTITELINRLQELKKELGENCKVNTVPYSKSDPDKGNVLRIIPLDEKNITDLVWINDNN